MVVLDDLDYSDEDLVKDGRWYQIVQTRNRNDKVAAFLEGRKRVGAPDPTGTQALGVDGFLHFLSDDEVTGDEESAGMIARLRIFNDALSAKKVRKLKP